jgi:hypothetical protein
VTPLERSPPDLAIIPASYVECHGRHDDHAPLSGALLLDGDEVDLPITVPLELRHFDSHVPLNL